MTITKRWLVSTILVISLILVAVACFASFMLHEYYYNASKDKIESIGQVSSLANFFSTYLNESSESFSDGAGLYVESFDYAHLCEVWVFNGNGKVVATTTGFLPHEQLPQDYELACSSSTGKGDWIGELSSGESVYAMTVMLPRTDGVSNGAVRFITSLEDINEQWANMTVLIFLICAFALLLVVLSGLYFVRSIVRPLNQLNGVTKRIAAGDFTVRAETSAVGDEINDLCQSINYMSEEINRTDQLKNDFISTVSHELRTPLTAIKGWSETLRDVVPQDNELLVNGLQVIEEETQRLYLLVEDLLDFSKIESGRMSLRLSLIDVLAELDMAVYVLRDRATREGIAIDYESPAFSAPMMGDADRIKQVFVNLIDNAVKYSPTGETVYIQVSEVENEIIISIRDNGCGIAEKDIPKIKEMFYKANLSVKGSGIGLAVCDEIVNRHGGSLNISSQLNIGTLVVVRLPLYNKNKDGKEL